MPQIRNTNIYPYDNDISPEDYLIGSDADTSNKKTKNFKIADLATFIQDFLIILTSGVNRIIRGSVFPIDGAFIFGSTNIGYSYRRRYRVAPARSSIVLTEPTSGFKRIDVFAVDIFTNTLVVIEGLESISAPQEPTINFGTQLRVTSVMVDENGVIGIDFETIYDENTGEPNEWTASTDLTNGTVDFSATDDPFVNTLHIEANNVTDPDKIIFTNDISVPVEDLSSINFGVYNVSNDLGGFNIYLSDGVNVVSDIVNVIDGEFGYDADSATDYTYVDISSEELRPTAPFTQIVFAFDNQAIISTIRFDRIRLVKGMETTPIGSSYLQLSDTQDNSYSGKREFIPYVSVDETGLVLKDSSVLVEFSDLYTGNAVLDGRVIHLGGLNYRILANRFIINNVFYNEFVSTDVTISAADVTNPRIDVFYIEKTDADTPAFGSVESGTPNASPVEPSLDLSTQVKVNFKLVTANETTEPPEIDTELIYDEDLGEPTEWDVNATLGTVNPSDSSTTPESGTVSTLLSPNLANTDASITFRKNSVVSFDSDNVLIIEIKTEEAWPSSAVLSVGLSDSNLGSSDSTLLNLNSSTAINYGFNATLSGQWQTLVIPLSEFNYNDPNYDTLYLRLRNRGGEFMPTFLDHIRIQTEIATPPQEVDISYLELNDSFDNDYIGKSGHSIVVNSNENGTELQLLPIPTGLEAIDEGNGVGWRLIGKDVTLYGNIGLDATDLSSGIFFGTSSTHGATGNYSLAANYSTIASGDASFAVGTSTIASGYASFAGGSSSTAIGNNSGVLAASLSEAKGNISFASGSQTVAESYSEFSIGTFNTSYTPLATNSIQATDRLFNIGNGTNTGFESDAFTVLKNGKTGIGYDNFETTSDAELLQVNGNVLATGYSTGGSATDIYRADGSITSFSASTTADTLTVIDLSNPLGNYCNVSSANASSTYTYQNEIAGGKAKVRINKSGVAPTITGATPIAGSAFVASTDMDMCVEYNGTTVEYYFLER